MPLEFKISRFTSIRQLGIFRNYSHSATTPDFSRYNLIFGFNGSGKTTLSRLFRSLELGTLGDDLKKDATYSVLLSNSTTIDEKTAFDRLRDKLLVFNADFIHENLRWDDASANPVFYIGHSANRLSLFLEKFEHHVAARGKRRTSAAHETNRSERLFNDFKTTLARRIARDLNFGRQYMAPNLQTDIDGPEITNQQILKPDEAQSYREILLQDNALPRVSLEFPRLPPTSFFSSLRSLLRSTPSTLVQSEFSDHTSMLIWLKEGLDYHDCNDLERCLLCGNRFTPERKSHLKRSLDQKFSDYFNSFSNFEQQIQSYKTALQHFQSTLPDRRDITPLLRTDFQDTVLSFTREINGLELILGEATKVLSVKKDDLANETHFLADDELFHVDELLRKLDRRFNNLQIIVNKHNERQDSFADEKRKAANSLKFSIILENIDELSSLQDSRDQARAELALWTRLENKAAGIYGETQKRVRDHGPAVDEINRFLASYLGHEEISLTPLETGYEIYRDGRKLVGPLSEGERTALAICYFICKIKENGRSVENLIVVVDDPISSLDFSSLHYAHGILKYELENAGQLFLLTHSLDFLNEARRWMRRENDKAKKKKLELPASFLHIEQTEPFARLPSLCFTAINRAGGGGSCGLISGRVIWSRRLSGNASRRTGGSTRSISWSTGRDWRRCFRMFMRAVRVAHRIRS